MSNCFFNCTIQQPVSSSCPTERGDLLLVEYCSRSRRLTDGREHIKAVFSSRREEERLHKH